MVGETENNTENNIMDFYRWFYQTIRQREYPLVIVPKIDFLHFLFPRTADVPYTEFCPDKICLVFSKSAKIDWSLIDNDIPDITEDILEHEYLHVILKHLIGFEASHKLNNVNRFSLGIKSSIWSFRDGKTFGHRQDLQKLADEVYRKIKRV